MKWKYDEKPTTASRLKGRPYDFGIDVVMVLDLQARSLVGQQETGG